jgi:hypothetical protein
MAAIRLPEVFFWAPQLEPPKVVKPFVQPGHETRPTQPRLLDAPPKLEPPSAEPSALNVPVLPDSFQALQLLKPPALPIRLSEAPGGVPRTGVSADTAAGDPTAVLSLALDPERMREFLSVPPGNQLGQLPEGGASGSPAITGAAGGSRAGGGAAGGGTGNGSGAGGTFTASSAPDRSATPQPAEVAAPTSATDAAWRSMALSAAAPTRIVHPAGGVFDIVVQSASPEGFPESAGVLSGKPVYTAYVKAGGTKDWLLQYCVPAGDEDGTRVTGPVVYLGSGTPLVAPYPRVTMRPPVKQRPGRHVMVHGYITGEGRFANLKILGASEPGEPEMVLPVLEQWEFRPASRDGKPVRVEILLAIPAE